MPPRTRKKEYELFDGRLWPNTPSGSPMQIEVFGATGEFKSGKTLLGLSIAPGTHPAGHPFAGQPRTLYLDFEKSGGTYTGAGCKRFDVPLLLMENYKGKYVPKQAFEWFQEIVETIQPDQFDVISADPITDVESGLVDYVKANCGAFGLSPAQVQKASGLLWGAVKDYWKIVLLKLSTRCQCFYFTSHLRDEWKGDKPSGRREPKGKETLLELASLYLWLDRNTDKDGKVPDVPSATVLKERLADTVLQSDGTLKIVRLMPARLPVATIDAICGYIANPPDPKRPKVGETLEPVEFTPEEKLRLELAKAEAERDAEGSRLTRLERTAELQAMMNQGGKTITSGAEAQSAAESEEPAKAEAEVQPEAEPPTYSEPVNPPGDKATRTQVAEIRRLFGDLQTPEITIREILAKVKVAEIQDLSRQHALLLIERLTVKQAEKTAAHMMGNE